MKNTFKYIMATILAGSMLFYSCETNDLELIDNPNSLTPDQADADLLLNSVQLAYLANMAVFNGNASNLTRLGVFGSRDYFAGITGLTLNATWARIYSTANLDTRGMIPNAANIEALNAARGDGSLNFQEGVSKVLIAHNLMLMVDFVGDIPLSQVNSPDEFPAPVADSGESVYAEALMMLEQAEGLIAGTTAGDDLFYDGDANSWIRLINTIRMKAALTTGDLAAFQAIEAGGNFIDETSEDFFFTYSENDVNPDGRHPDYVNDYTTAGANIFQSNWLMNLMLENDDPRIRYYFFRQSDCTPGASCNPNPTGEAVTQLQCSIQEPPVHLSSTGFGDIFCFLEDGYWGRTHGDDSGVGPDNFNRTASGVYPAGGYVDGDNFRNGSIELDSDTGMFEFVPDNSDNVVNLGVGGLGAGIEPFILSSYVDFMRAEVALATGNAAGAATFIEAGLTKSIDLVQSFGALDTSLNPEALLDGTNFDPMTGDIIGEAERVSSVLPTSDDNDDYIDAIIAEFLAATPGPDQWNILAEQNWVTQYGGGAETYNFYRRTGFPTTLVPNLEPNPGSFVRSFPYPNAEVIANPNISQKADQSVQVFWDNNPPSAVTGGFPASN